MNSVKEILKQIAIQMTNNFNSGIENNEGMLWEIYEKAYVIQEKQYRIQEVEEICILKEVVYDIFSSVYLASVGLYRTAYLNIRSSLELTLGFLYFVDRRYYFWQWKKNIYDIKWSELVDQKDGIVSKTYIEMFNKIMDEEQINILISTTKDAYRVCSEYVHGKFDFMQTSISEQISFNQEEFNKWAETIMKVMDIIIEFIEIRFSPN